MNTKTKGARVTATSDEVVVSVRDRAVLKKAFNEIFTELVDSCEVWVEAIDDNIEDVATDNYLFVGTRLKTVVKSMRDEADMLEDLEEYASYVQAKETRGFFESVEDSLYAAR